MSAPLLYHDREMIADILSRDRYLHIYETGDLDAFYWKHTRWFGMEGIREVVLLYSGMEIPTLLAFSDDITQMRRLIASLAHQLPASFYAHLSPGLEEALSAHYDIESRGEHLKMGLLDQSRIQSVDVSGTVELGPEDADELSGFYRESYPGNWFDPRMLETGRYFGLRSEGSIISAAGVHVYSREYGVAALGNVATSPVFRGRGYGKAVTARTCKALVDSGCIVGLNVAAENGPAIACYQGLGFRRLAGYGEFMMTRKT